MANQVTKNIATTIIQEVTTIPSNNQPNGL